jgi:hypothetical protein
MKITLSPLRLGISFIVCMLALVACGGGDSAPETDPQASLVGRFAISGGAGVAEIVAFHAESKSVFMTRDTTANPSSFQRVSLRTLNSVPLANATSTSNLESGVVTSVAANVNTTSFTAGGVQALAISGNLLAVAVQATPKTDSGLVAFYRLDAQGNATYLKRVMVGSLPDGVAFAPDGSKLIVANEGELDTNFGTTGIDPEGSISIIAITGGTPADTATTLDFTAFNTGGSRASELPTGVRISRAGASVAQDMEPEYVTVSADSSKAYVTLQENNAVAVVNLSNNTIERFFAMGYKDHGLAANAIAPSDRVTATVSALKTYSNLFGVYMPDGISSFTVGTTTYFITANEGDDRDDFLPSGQKETARVSTLTLDALAFPTGAVLKADTELGRLTVFTNLGKNGSGNFEKLYALGARSFSIYNASTGSQVFDSGSELEKRAYETLPSSLLTNAQVKDRLDNKGPEPESVVVGVVRGKTLAFVGLERSSAIMVYDLSNPAAPRFVQWLQNTTTLADGDISPEGLSFVPAAQSPTGNALLLVGYEVSGTIAVWEIK